MIPRKAPARVKKTGFNIESNKRYEMIVRCFLIQTPQVHFPDTKKECSSPIFVVLLQMSLSAPVPPHTRRISTRPHPRFGDGVLDFLASLSCHG